MKSTLSFTKKIIFSFRRTIDQIFFTSTWKQIVTLTLLFMILVLACSHFYNSFNTDIQSNSPTNGYFDHGFLWSLLHATDPGYVGADVEILNIKGFWLGMIVTILGWFILSGFIMTIFVNSYQRHLDKLESGLIRYYLWGQHFLIFGWNQMGASIVSQLKEEKNKPVVIISLTSADTIRNQIRTMIAETPEQKISQNNIYVYNGLFTTARELQYCNFKKTDRVIILGEDNQLGLDSQSSQIIARINDLSNKRKKQNPLPCYVHIANLRTYDLLQDIEMKKIDKIDFKPFNFYEDWARRLWSTFPEAEDTLNRSYPPLAYRDIYPNKQVHLIIIGFGQMGQALAAQAARICHYSNNAKTRLTIIDPLAETLSEEFLSHSFINRIPDIELEFLPHSVENQSSRKFLEKTIFNDNQIPTIAVCISDPDKALSTTLALPQKVLLSDTPILVRQETRYGISNLVEKLRDNERWSDIYCFGMMHQCYGLDVKQDKLAKELHKQYYVAHPEYDEVLWEDLSENLRWANRYFVDSIPELIAASNYVLKNIENITSPDFSPENNQQLLEILSEREHDRWMAEKIISGWTQADLEGLATIDEIKSKRDNLKRKHIFLVPYKNLDEIEPGTKQKDRDIILNLNSLLRSINVVIKKKGE